MYNNFRMTKTKMFAMMEWIVIHVDYFKEPMHKGQNLLHFGQCILSYLNRR